MPWQLVHALTYPCFANLSREREADCFSGDNVCCLRRAGGFPGLATTHDVRVAYVILGSTFLPVVYLVFETGFFCDVAGRYVMLGTSRVE